jgi:hypothetical protein
VRRPRRLAFLLFYGVTIVFGSYAARLAGIARRLLAVDSVWLPLSSIGFAAVVACWLPFRIISLAAFSACRAIAAEGAHA